MQRRRIVQHRRNELVDHFGARHAGRRQRLERLFEIAIDAHAIGERTQIAALAGGDQQPERLVQARRRMGGVGIIRAAVIAGVLQRGLVRQIAGSQNGGAARAIFGGVFGQAALGDPAGEFVAVEMRMARVGHRRRDAVLECQEGVVGALRRPRRVPHARHRPHAFHASAGDQPDHLDLMRRLVVDGAAALPRVELFGTARAVEEVGEVESGDHAQCAIGAAFHQGAQPLDRRIEGMGMPDDQMHAGLARGADHAVACVERQRHRFFDQGMPAVRGGDLDLRRMKLVRRGDVDRVDVARAERLHGLVSRRPEVLREARAGLGARIEAGDDLDARIVAEGRDHEGEGAPDARDAQPDLPRAHSVVLQRSSVTSPTPRDTQTMMLSAFS